jgi:cell wall-associated NlpC family hydrolase
MSVDYLNTRKLDKITKTILFFSLATLTSFLTISCKSSSGGRRLNVVTYEKKRGSGNSSYSNRHYSARKPSSSRSKKKEEYFDFDESGNKVTNRTARTPGRSKSTMSASGQAIQVIKTARSYLGTKYEYGGTSKSGMDCSGLLCTSFEAVNIKLPRPSHEQATYGPEVDLDEIAPGDLVFFSERKGSHKVSHVGMVTAVRGGQDVTFIHSSTSRGVVEDNLYTEYYQKIFVKAIRPF